jgi:hypothetical protein
VLATIPTAIVPKQALKRKDYGAFADTIFSVFHLWNFRLEQLVTVVAIPLARAKLVPLPAALVRRRGRLQAESSSAMLIGRRSPTSISRTSPEDVRWRTRMTTTTLGTANQLPSWGHLLG